jgi:hypothetical protein
VHYDEYVVPKKVLFSNDPVVPNIVILRLSAPKPTNTTRRSQQFQTNQSSSNRNNGLAMLFE